MNNLLMRTACNFSFNFTECVFFHAIFWCQKRTELVCLHYSIASRFVYDSTCVNRHGDDKIYSFVRVKKARVSIASLPGNKMWPSALLSVHFPECSTSAR